jgi:dienelactone hydrolase
MGGAQPTGRAAEQPLDREPPAPLPSDPADAAHELFERYERRFAEARLRQPDRNPARPADREAITRAAKACLGIRDDWIPTVEAETARTVEFDGGRIELLRATSWPGVRASALLYVPDGAGAQRRPLVVLCCGHGKGGKLSPGYQRMARHLARRGAMVLCPDNIGQGEREPMGHRACVVPFACGLSVQGLIVMETLGWIGWARQQARVDPERLAAIGNSGGGTLTVFLAALCPELAALSSSGYPSTFDFVARKEKRHCHCNVLPGVVGELEMWHLLGSFAPRPMFIFQGSGDNLFPEDLFYHTARKVRHVYRLLGAEKAFHARVFPGAHSWDIPRYRPTGDFLAGPLGLGKPLADEDFDEPVLGEADRCWDKWPADAINADGLAQQLSGRQIEGNPSLAEVFLPREVPDDLANLAPRGPSRQILAQYEAFLSVRQID